MPKPHPGARAWCLQHKLHLPSRSFILVVKQVHSSKVRQQALRTGSDVRPSSSGFSGSPGWGIGSKRFKTGGVPGSPVLMRRGASLLVPLCSCMTSALLAPHFPSDRGSPSILNAPLLREPRISSEQPHLPVIS